MTAIPTSSFADRLRQYRRAAGLTQEALAERAGLSVHGIQKLEQGTTHPYRDTANRLAQALELSPEDEARFRAAIPPLRRHGRTGTAEPSSPALRFLEGEPGSTPEVAERNGMWLQAPHGAGFRVASTVVTSSSPGQVTTDTNEPGTRSLFTTAVPRHLTSFVGRERELAQVDRLLSNASGGSRLLTLTGPGGCGKTRLALRAAEHGQAKYAGGVGIVELAALADPVLIPEFVASALMVRDVPGRPILVTLVEHLRAQEVLVVLDNCEHLVDACARLVETLLLSCPRLSILATSREMLGVPGEIAWAVPALSTPNPDDQPVEPVPRVSEMRRYEAVRLFEERARLVDPSFEMTEQNAAVLARICRRLDGMPLPIELAAARMRLLTPEQIEDRLNDVFQVLSTASRGVTPRHRTLWAAIDWSYGLLDEPEQTLLRRLSVFAGGFTLETAEAVWHASLEALGQLVDKSLVVAEPSPSGAMRYRLLETIRQYSREKLRACGELSTARRTHGEYFLQLAETAEPHLTSGNRPRWLSHLEAEHDNVRAALDWSRQEGGDIEVGLRLVGALMWFWNMHNHLSEGRARAEAILAHPGAADGTAIYARALSNAGALAWLQGDYELSRTRLGAAVETWQGGTGSERGLGHALTVLGLAELRSGDPVKAAARANESVVLFRRINDPWGLAWALNNLGYVASASGDTGSARAFLTESLERFRKPGDPWGKALPLSNLGHLAYRLGDHLQAQAQLEESLAIFRELGHFWAMPPTLNSLGNVARSQGARVRAAALYSESLHLCREHGDQVGVAVALLSLARVEAEQGNHLEAVRLFRQSLTTFRRLDQQRGIRECLVGLAELAIRNGRAEDAVRLLAAIGVSDERRAPLPPQPVRGDAERELRQARTMLNATAFDAAWQHGRSLRLDDAVDHALRLELSEPVPLAATADSSGQAPAPLTIREAEVAALIGRGFSNRQIAEVLIISERTAESHVAHILTRLGFSSRAQIAVWAAGGRHRRNR